MVYEVFIMVLFVLTLGALEARLDQLLWESGRSDKPWSTIVRGFFLISTGLLTADTYGVYWWQMLLFTSSLYFLFFDYELNLIRGKHIFHTGSGNWYEKARKKMGPWIELFIKLWIAITAYGVYAHLDWIV